MITVDALVERGYLASLEGRPSWRRYTQVYEKILKPTFGSQPAAQVTRLQMIQLVQQPLPPTQKRKAIGLMQQAYRWGTNTVNPHTKALYYEGLNPAANIPLEEQRSRERMATHAELSRILSELPFLARIRPLHAAFFAIRLSTPCRISELTSTEPKHWQPHELVAGKTGAWWHKPTTKNGMPQTVYVPWQAMAYAQPMAWEHTHCFPGIGGRPHWSEFTATKAWKKWMKELGIETLQLLDVRRTLASYLYRMHRRQEVDDLTIKALLNHYDGRPVAIYTRLDIDSLAKILQGYADWLWALPNGGNNA